MSDDNAILAAFQNGEIYSCSMPNDKSDAWRENLNLILKDS